MLCEHALHYTYIVFTMRDCEHHAHIPKLSAYNRRS